MSTRIFDKLTSQGHSLTVEDSQEGQKLKIASPMKLSESDRNFLQDYKQSLIRYITLQSRDYLRVRAAINFVNAIDESRPEFYEGLSTEEKEKLRRMPTDTVEQIEAWRNAVHSLFNKLNNADLNAKVATNSKGRN